MTNMHSRTSATTTPGGLRDARVERPAFGLLRVGDRRPGLGIAETQSRSQSGKVGGGCSAFKGIGGGDAEWLAAGVAESAGSSASRGEFGTLEAGARASSAACVGTVLLDGAIPRLWTTRRRSLPWPTRS